VFGSKRRAEKKTEAENARNAELRQLITNLIALAQGETSSSPDGSLVLRSGERLVALVRSAGLFEPRREAGHWSGRSAGVSVPVFDTGLRVRVGKSAGTYVQGAEKPTVIDGGDVSITTQRVVFQGGKYTREWEFSKLIGVVHYSDQPATAIQVSNREKTSGVVYADVHSPELVRLPLTVAIAIFHGENEETVKELRDELARIDDPGGTPVVDAAPAASDANEQKAMPPAPVNTTIPAPSAEGTKLVAPAQAPSPALPPPMWAADPTGRHQWRYWDGKIWTEYVTDNGHESQDPTAPSV
jgi:hypothetical protein